MTNKRRKRLADIFYVYVLFDHTGKPRYIGKGKGDRWLKHGLHKERKINPFKAKFMDQTLKVLSEVPKIKVAEDLSEKEALELESLLIKAIGRYPDGPLENLTDKMSGTTSE